MSKVCAEMCTNVPAVVEIPGNKGMRFDVLACRNFNTKGSRACGRKRVSVCTGWAMVRLRRGGNTSKGLRRMRDETCNTFPMDMSLGGCECGRFRWIEGGRTR